MLKLEKERCSELQCRMYLSRIKKGNEKALEMFYRDFKYPIFLFAMSYCKNKQLAEDVLQETFLKVICHVDNYREQGSAKAWIFTIAKNLCLDTLEKQKASMVTEEQASEPDYTHLEVDEALRTLTEPERSVIRLHVFAGLKLKEIASLLCLPIGKVRYARRSANKKLRRFYSTERRDNPCEASGCIKR